MKKPGLILTSDASVESIEIVSVKSQTYDMAIGIYDQKPKYKVATDIYLNGSEESIAAVWSLTELFHLTISIWWHAIKAAFGKRN